MGGYEPVKIACPGDLKSRVGQAIIIAKNRELTSLIINAPLWPLGQEKNKSFFPSGKGESRRGKGG